VESDHNRVSPEKFLTGVLERMVGGDEQGMRQWIVGWVGLAELARGEYRVERDDGRAALAVNMLGDNAVKVWAERGGSTMEMSLDALEARAYVLAANATATALGFVRELFGDVLEELESQHGQLCAGIPPTRPAATVDGDATADLRAYERGYADALAEMRRGNENCPHAGLPPADSVEPFGFRACSVCGKRMRVYPSSVTGAAPEWREAM
jgi:hypothetical protein